MAHDFPRTPRRSRSQRIIFWVWLILSAFVLVLLSLTSRVAEAQSANSSGLQASTSTWTLTDKERIQGLIAQGQAQQALSELLYFGSRPYGQAEFDYLLGLAALESGQYALALESLERVVLVNPQHAGAWLDLAVVHYRLRDYEAARLLVQHVQDNFTPNQTVATQIHRLQRQLKWAPYTRDWLIELSTHAGYVKNVNAGLSNLTFSLTPLGGLPISVRADERQAPRSDFAALLRANAYRLVNHAGGAYSEWMVSVGTRQYQTERSYDISDLGAMWLYTQPWRGMEWQSGPSFREIVVGGRSVGEVYGVQTSLWNHGAGCRYAPKLELEHRQYREASYYSNSIPWLGGVIRCERTNYLYGLSGRYGLDYPQNSRPGGRTDKVEWMAFGRYQINPVWSVETSLGYSKYKDQETYSPLVADGAPRQVDRWVGRLGVDWQAKALGYKDMYVSAYYDYYRDQSNIVFSNIRDQQFFIGLKYLIR